MQNTDNSKEPLLVYVNGYHCIEAVHETTETTNNDKVTETMRGSYLIYADEHTKVLMNNIKN